VIINIIDGLRGALLEILACSFDICGKAYGVLMFVGMEILRPA